MHADTVSNFRILAAFLRDRRPPDLSQWQQHDEQLPIVISTRLAILTTKQWIKQYTIPDQLYRNIRFATLARTSEFKQHFPIADGPTIYKNEDSSMDNILK